MSPPGARGDRSHGEEYPGGSDPGRPQSDEDRYGANRERAKPGSDKRDKPKPAAPPPHHERNS
jgi:hypothetical protein